MLYLVINIYYSFCIGLCYNGDFKSNKFFGYTSEGNIKLFEIQ